MVRPAECEEETCGTLVAVALSMVLPDWSGLATYFAMKSTLGVTSAADDSWTIDDRVAALGEVPPLSLKESSCVFVQTVRDAEGVVPTEGPFEAEYSCQFTWKRNSGCVSIKEVTPFESIPTSFWWALVTMTTVGYGDMWPVYWYGKALGMIIMLSGILVIALPITVIGANFAEVYKEAMIYQDNKVAQSSGRSSGRRGAAA